MLCLQHNHQHQARSHTHVVHTKHHSRSRLVVHAFKRGTQLAETAQASTATTSSPSSSEVQVAIAVPLEQSPTTQQQSSSASGLAWVLVAAAVAAGFVFKKLKSSDTTREYMHSINSMQTDNLDPEIIAAARARRSRERANHRLDLDEVELPENHPWATRKPVTAEQEAAIQARLQARPRRTGPPADGRSGARTRQLGRE